MQDTWAAGDPYEAYVGRWSRALAPTFVDWARIPPGANVLDVGCGTGALSEALFARGAARVTGLDPSPGFLQTARTRVPRGNFVEGDAQAIAADTGAFDAAVSGIALNFVPEPQRAAREMARVVRGGGVVAAYVWDYAGQMELMRHFWDAALALDPARAASLDEGARFPLCQPDALARLFRDAGLRDVSTSHVDQPTVFRDFDDYWAPFLGGQGPAPGYCMSLAPRERERLRETVRARLPIAPDGRIALIARAWTVRGVTPRAAP